MSGLKLIDVDGDLLAAALDIMRRYQLDPRDSIHVVSALSEKAEEIIPVDEHFDKLTEIKRRSI